MAERYFRNKLNPGKVLSETELYGELVKKAPEMGQHKQPDVINAFMEDHGNEWEPYDQEKGNYIQDVYRNLPSSTGRVLHSLGQVIAHPLNTAAGAVGLLTPEGVTVEIGKDDQGNPQYGTVGGAPAREKAWQFATERAMHPLDTIRYDPAGAAQDLSMVLGGAGIALEGAGAVSTVGTLSRLGRAATIGSRALDPITLVTGATGAALRPIRDWANTKMYRHMIQVPPNVGSKMADEVVAQGAKDFITPGREGMAMIKHDVDLGTSIRDKAVAGGDADIAGNYGVDTGKVVGRMEKDAEALGNVGSADARKKTYWDATDEYLRAHTGTTLNPERQPGVAKAGAGGPTKTNVNPPMAGSMEVGAWGEAINSTEGGSLFKSQSGNEFVVKRPAGAKPDPNGLYPVEVYDKTGSQKLFTGDESTVGSWLTDPGLGNVSLDEVQKASRNYWHPTTPEKMSLKAANEYRQDFNNVADRNMIKQQSGTAQAAEVEAELAIGNESRAQLNSELDRFDQSHGGSLFREYGEKAKGADAGSVKNFEQLGTRDKNLINLAKWIDAGITAMENQSPMSVAQPYFIASGVSAITGLLSGEFKFFPGIVAAIGAMRGMMQKNPELTMKLAWIMAEKYPHPSAWKTAFKMAESAQKTAYVGARLGQTAIRATGNEPPRPVLELNRKVGEPAAAPQAGGQKAYSYDDLFKP